MELQYRIKEYDGKFYIQVKGREIEGMLWWKKDIWDWYKCNELGGVPEYFTPRCRTFKSLKDAKDQIKSWQKGAIYHKI